MTRQYPVRPGPYALRYSAGRPEGSYATIAAALAAARPGAAVVTREGWWIVERKISDRV